MNTRAKLIIATITLTASALVAGCGFESTRPPLDATWGLSVRMAVENQKLDPSLGGDRPVVGLDGVFAKNTLEGYRKSAEYDTQVGKTKDPQYLLVPMHKESK